MTHRHPTAYGPSGPAYGGMNESLVRAAAVIFFLVAFGFVVRDFVLPDPPVPKEMLGSKFTMSNGPCEMILICEEKR